MLHIYIFLIRLEKIYKFIIIYFEFKYILNEIIDCNNPIIIMIFFKQTITIYQKIDKYIT